MTPPRRAPRGDATTPAADIVGSGWPFPVRPAEGGAIPLVSGGDDVDGALRFLLATAPGERLMRPDFGCAVWDLLFDPLNSSTLGGIEQAVREAVLRWEPRVDLEGVDVTPDAEQPQVYVTLRYRLRATNERRNLVYPFYVLPREPAGPAVSEVPVR